MENSVWRRLRRAKRGIQKNKILEDHFRENVYGVYMQFSGENRCICGLVYMQFQKVDIHTGLD